MHVEVRSPEDQIIMSKGRCLNNLKLLYLTWI